MSVLNQLQLASKHSCKDIDLWARIPEKYISSRNVPRFGNVEILIETAFRFWWEDLTFRPISVTGHCNLPCQIPCNKLHMPVLILINWFNQSSNLGFAYADVSPFLYTNHACIIALSVAFQYFSFLWLTLIFLLVKWNDQLSAYSYSGYLLYSVDLAIRVFGLGEYADDFLIEFLS